MGSQWMLGPGASPLRHGSPKSHQPADSKTVPPIQDYFTASTTTEPLVADYLFVLPPKGPY